jgi:hypothetical protein
MARQSVGCPDGSEEGSEAPVAIAYPPAGAWPLILDHLDLVRRQWDLAIIANLRGGGVRPGELLRAINAQAEGRRLTWKVMAERLRWLYLSSAPEHELAGAPEAD